MRCAPRALTKRERLALAAAWVLLTLGAGLVAHDGIDLADEGYIIYPIQQVASGLVPFRDIGSLYTPLAWYLEAVVFKVMGTDLVALRWFFGAVSAALAVGVYVLARQLVAPLWAAAAAATYVLVFPIPQVWAPYPAWYALGGLLVSLVAFGTWPRRRQPRWLLVVGVGCAWAFGTKPSLGLFGLLAFCLYLVLRAGSLSSQSQRATPADNGMPHGQTRWVVPTLQGLAVLLTAAAFWLLIRGVASPGNQALFVGTLAVVGLALVEPPAASNFTRLARETLGRAGWLVGGFLLATLPWYAALSMVAGWQRVFDSIFLEGAATAAAFYEPVFTPNRDAWEAIGWIAAGGLGCVLLRWLAMRNDLRLNRRRWIVAAGILAAALLALALTHGGPGGAGAYLLLNVRNRLGRNASSETDLLPFVLWLTLWASALVLLRRRARSDPRTLLFGALTLFDACFAFQLYPHASYRHVLFTIGPFLPLWAVLAQDTWQWVRPSLPTLCWQMAAGIGLLVFPLLMVPTSVRARLTMLNLPGRIDTATAHVTSTSDQQAEVNMLEHHFAGMTPGAPVFAYPALPMVYFLTGHPNPSAESYLPARYLSADRIQAVIASLEQSRPRYVVWADDQVQRDGLGPNDQVLVDFIHAHYGASDVAGSVSLLEINGG